MPATHDCDLITMLGEVKAIEPQLKQILYGCVEHVQATKAALYLSASHDLSEKTYELVTAYQFNDGVRRVVKSNDDLVDRLAVKRNAFVVNGLAVDMRFSEMLFRQGTDRLLALPLFSRGRLVGFIDMRDKAGKKPFENPDVEAARRIGDEVLRLLGSRKLFGVAPIPLAEMEQPTAAGGGRASMPTLVMQSVQAPAVVQRGAELSPQAMSAIQSARDLMAKRQHQTPSGKRILGERDIEVVRL